MRNEITTAQSKIIPLGAIRKNFPGTQGKERLFGTSYHFPKDKRGRSVLHLQFMITTVRIFCRRDRKGSVRREPLDRLAEQDHESIHFLPATIQRPNLGGGVSSLPDNGKN